MVDPKVGFYLGPGKKCCQSYDNFSYRARYVNFQCQKSEKMGKFVFIAKQQMYELNCVNIGMLELLLRT